MCEWVLPCCWSPARRKAGSYRLVASWNLGYFNTPRMPHDLFLLAFLPSFLPPNKGVPLFAQRCVSITAWFWHGKLWAVLSLWFSVLLIVLSSVKPLRGHSLVKWLCKGFGFCKEQLCLSLFFLEGCFLHDCSKIRESLLPPERGLAEWVRCMTWLQAEPAPATAFSGSFGQLRWTLTKVLFRSL